MVSNAILACLQGSCLRYFQWNGMLEESWSTIQGFKPSIDILLADGLQGLNSFVIYSWILESRQRRHAVVRDVGGSAAVSSILFWNIYAMSPLGLIKDRIAWKCGNLSLSYLVILSRASAQLPENYPDHTQVCTLCSCGCLVRISGCHARLREGTGLWSTCVMAGHGCVEVEEWGAMSKSFMDS